MIREAGGVLAAAVEAQEKEVWATKVDISMEDMKTDRNGHDCVVETNGHHSTNSAISESCPSNGNDSSFFTCSAVHPTLPSPSPCASPVLSKRSSGTLSPGGYHSPYQAGINQRFHAARHKFQGTAEPDSQSTQSTQSPPSPKDASPWTSSTTLESSPVKQMARSTVTQVLSRFTTVQQSTTAKQTAPNNSPFGTDYRSLAAPLSPIIGRAAGALSQGIRSPTIPRADRGHPPPIPPKKPGLAQAPASPAAVPRSASHFSDNPLSGSCGLTSSQEGVKELDMVVSSN